MSLSLSTEPIPAKLAHRIQNGQFVEMRDLLGDNNALTQHFKSANSYFLAHILPVSFHPRLREVSSLSLWIYCFLEYLAMGTLDESTHARLIYAQLIVREVLQHGGRAWLDYNRLFHQQAALNAALALNTLHPSLVASTILSQQSEGGSFRNLCQGVDHLPSSCAMAYLQNLNPSKGDAVVGPGRPSRPVCRSWNEGRCSFYPGQCFHQHVYASCGSVQHRARDCWKAPAASCFKKRGRSSETGLPASGG